MVRLVRNARKKKFFLLVETEVHQTLYRIPLTLEEVQQMREVLNRNLVIDVTYDWED
jgi:hypothetical protein